MCAMTVNVTIEDAATGRDHGNVNEVDEAAVGITARGEIVNATELQETSDNEVNSHFPFAPTLCSIMLTTSSMKMAVEYVKGADRGHAAPGEAEVLTLTENQNEIDRRTKQSVLTTRPRYPNPRRLSIQTEWR